MGCRIEIDPDSGVAIGTFTDVCDAAASQAALETLWQMPAWKGLAVVWDARQSDVQVSAQEIQKVAQFILEGQPNPPPLRVGFVTRDELSFGLMRMLEVYREDPMTETRVLRDFDQALDWARRAGDTRA